MNKPVVLIIAFSFLLVALIGCTYKGRTETSTPSVTTPETVTQTSSTAETTETIATTATTPYTLPLNTTVDLNSINVSHIVITPDTATITAGESQLFIVMAYDFQGNSYDVTHNAVFSISSGAGGFWVFNKYTSENAGIWEITADYWNPGDGTEYWRDQATLIVK